LNHWRLVGDYRFESAVRICGALPREHKSTGKGRDQAREASKISFHSLRHSAVTILKAAGVSDFIAREIIGHESAAVSPAIHTPNDGR